MYSDKELLNSIENATKDKALSDAALKIFLTIKLFHEHETISIAELQLETGHGRDKLSQAIEVLIDKEYLEKDRVCTELGRFGNYRYKTLK